MSFRQFTKENSSLILAVGAGIGVVATAYLSAEAGYKTRQALEHEKGMDLRDKVWYVWKLYIPAGTAGAVTILCVVGSKRSDGRKTLAAQTALAVSQRAYEGYRAQVIEELGERKDKTLLAKVAEKQVNENPPPAIIAGSGPVLCCELHTGRYRSEERRGGKDER